MKGAMHNKRLQLAGLGLASGTLFVRVVLLPGVHKGFVSPSEHEEEKEEKGNRAGAARAVASGASGPHGQAGLAAGLIVE